MKLWKWMIVIWCDVCRWVKWQGVRCWVKPSTYNIELSRQGVNCWVKCQGVILSQTFNVQHWVKPSTHNIESNIKVYTVESNLQGLRLSQMSTCSIESNFKVYAWVERQGVILSQTSTSPPWAFTSTSSPRAFTSTLNPSIHSLNYFYFLFISSWVLKPNQYTSSTFTHYS